MNAGVKKSRKRLYIGVALAMAVVGGAAGFATLKGASPDVDASRLATVERGTMVKSVVATGKVEPITKIEIKSKANGIIKALNADIDLTVKEGDILVELDKEQLAAALRGAEANLLAARASFEGCRSASTKEYRRGRRAGRRVRPSRIRPRQIAVRAEPRSPNPRWTMRTASSTWPRTASVRRSRNWPSARRRSTEARAQVAQAKAAADRAAEDVANATIRAPIRGTVLSRDVEIGSPVSSILNLGANATLVMTLGDIAQVFVRGKVDEADIGRVRLGQQARISVETFKDKSFNGRVTQISPMGVEKDNVTSFEVRVSIDNPGKELKANMTANAEIVLEEHPDSLIVPEAAITYDAQKQAFVDVLAPGSKTGRKKVQVKVGVGNGTKIQISTA